MKGIGEWRSMLYVPGHRFDFLAKAHQRGADAVILDLEDGVPDQHKETARDALLQSVDALAGSGTPVAVRINTAWKLAWHDLSAVAATRASAILMPKLESVHRARVVDEMLLELGLETSMMPLIGLIETAKGLRALPAIIDSVPRIRVVIPGNEDLAADMGISSEPEHMEPVLIPVVVVARAHGVRLIGTMGGNTQIEDLDAFRRRVARARAWGFSGATCFHPSQVPIVNEVYGSDPSILGHARRIVEAFEASDGGAILVDGRMVDRPVYLRARHLLSEHEGGE